ncbi:aldehyde dehydrogenase [Rhizoclosmatium globosum]|uniref:Succinate-semialdehyde dehydrogenase, mitochondrial n=1 Tax=Rhizoclosmatium globosum TaxID=329046 RepID=A0A1Y2D0Z9_9FUNG|nr:aldehyde dehydrogenase [Rhizoclosmatium globosum]|eukprot:ORY52940.1 aldehyde dehydrogenase [Rhizoclosmatium globosum]
MLTRWYTRIIENSDDLAAIATLEAGKPLREAKGEVLYAASFIQFFAHEALRSTGDTIPSPHPQNKTRLWTVKQPVGPCALITPWNFPLAMATRKIGPALAAGNSCILKPAPETPLSALALKLLANDAGIPNEAFQVLTADRENAKDIVGKELMADMRIRKVSFTGSTGAGIALMEQAAKTVKRASMELGGNAPLIVFNDADIDKAVEGCVGAKFRNAGQVCIAINRVFVQSSVHDTFVNKLVARMKSLRIGNGFDSNTTIGPLITPLAVERVQSIVNATIAVGAQLTFQSTISDAVRESGGNFFPPTVLTNVTDSMPVFQSEIFGPVVAISKFETEEEVLSRANNTPYGLAGYVYTRDVSRVHRVSEALEVGMVGVNETAISNELGPFGGVKLSGVGREGSKDGIEEFLETKYVSLGL